MKRMNYKRKLFSYCLIWSVFLSSLLFYSPADIVLSAPGDPYIEATNPSEGKVMDVATVEFTGSISDDSTPADQLSLRVFEQTEAISEPVEITNEGQLSISVDGQNGTWLYSKEFSDGNHSLTFIVEDGEGNSAEITRIFTVNKTIVEQQKDIMEEPTFTKPVGAFTETESLAVAEVQGTRPYIVDLKIIPPGVTDVNDYLPVEDMTQVPLKSTLMMVIREAGLLTFTRPLIVSSNKGEVISKENIEGTPPQRNENGDYVITFTPTKPLDTSTTYYVYVNPTILNELGNRIFPRFFKFSTLTINHVGDIHGNYTNNTNACAYCHSTHNGKNASLEGGSYESEAGNYCMACHDGTNGSSMPDKYNSNNKHAQHATGEFKGSESCTGCHNPHTAWTKENPARLQSVQVSGSSHFQTFAYKKAGTASGNAEDFSLCFNCHEGTKASNIKQYYGNETLRAESGHNITAEDGSALNGQLACADCHETHGSNNLMLLKEELGNIKRADGDKFKTTGTAWDAATERQFCLKCHNNTTELYGKTGTYKDKNTLGDPISGHQPQATQSCSSCHGGAKQSAVEAAHAPKKEVHVPK